MRSKANQTVFLSVTTLFLHCFTPGVALALETDELFVEGYFRVIWGMLIVLGIMLLLYAFVKKRFSLYAGSPDQRIKVIEIKPLMQKKSLCLIEVSGEEYLLGISADRIEHIAKISKNASGSFAETLQEKVQENKP